MKWYDYDYRIGGPGEGTSLAKLEKDVVGKSKPMTDDQKAQLVERFKRPRDEWERLFFNRSFEHPAGKALLREAFDRVNVYED